MILIAYPKRIDVTTQAWSEFWPLGSSAHHAAYRMPRKINHLRLSPHGAVCVLSATLLPSAGMKFGFGSDYCD